MFKFLLRLSIPIKDKLKKESKKEFISMNSLIIKILKNYFKM